MTAHDPAHGDTLDRLTDTLDELRGARARHALDLSAGIDDTDIRLVLLVASILDQPTTRRIAAAAGLDLVDTNVALDCLAASALIRADDDLWRLP